MIGLPSTKSVGRPRCGRTSVSTARTGAVVESHPRAEAAIKSFSVAKLLGMGRHFEDVCGNIDSVAV